MDGPQVERKSMTLMPKDDEITPAFLASTDSTSNSDIESWATPSNQYGDDFESSWDKGPDQPHVPFITHDEFPEFTIKGVILGVFLSIMLAAANAYLGLLVGLTVSASIPASVISMALLRIFPSSNILENNIVQTIASAGEILAAGVIFTLPGLVILTNIKNGDVDDKYNTADTIGNYDGWDTFVGVNYAYGTLLAIFGGLLGIAWSIPIRKAMLREITPPLKFPEGVATAYVLKAGEDTSKSALSLGIGSLVGSLTSLLSSFKLWSSTKIEAGWLYRGLHPSQFAFEVKAALFGVGYLVGPNIATVLFMASFIQNIILLPLSSVVHPSEGLSGGTPLEEAKDEFNRSKYIGVGIMIIGAAWSLFSVRNALISSVKLGLKEFSDGIIKSLKSRNTIRQDVDIPIIFVFALATFSLFGIWIVISLFNGKWAKNIVFVILIAISSFVFSAVSAYMAGLVGSSNNPISGVTICNGLLVAALTLGLFGADDPLAPATTMLLCCSVASACAISGDQMQDFKTGYILGATPWKQQVAKLIGVLLSAAVITAVLEILNEAYFLGDPNTLSAPQATILLDLSIGILSGITSWRYILLGLGLGIIVVLVDTALVRKKVPFRIPVLAFAVGNYLSPGTIAPLFVGGMIHLLNSYRKKGSEDKILYSAGLVAGDSLLSVILAIPIVVTDDEHVIELIPPSSQVLWPIVFPIIWLILPMFIIDYEKIFRIRK